MMDLITLDINGIEVSFEYIKNTLLLHKITNELNDCHNLSSSDVYGVIKWAFASDEA